MPRLSRRELMKLALAGALGGTSLNASAQKRRSFSSISSSNNRKSPPRYLILVELRGGNDGYNTLVPYTDPHYYRARPTLAIPKDEVLMLDESYGLHPALASFASFWEKRELSILPRVSYPNPALTHFRASEIWDTALTGDKLFGNGWVEALEPMPEHHREYIAHGVTIGRNSGPMEGAKRLLQFDRLSTLIHQLEWGVTSSVDASNEALSHINQIEASLARSAILPHKRIMPLPETAEFPGSPFGEDLADLTQMILSGVGAPVMKVSLGSFDTHEDQATRHANLLADLADGLWATRETLLEAGHWPQVAFMLYSEFGRTLAENAQRGTDHGPVAPMLLLGRPMRAGIYPPEGEYTDFRRVYNTMINSWLGTHSKRLSRREFPPLGILDSSFRREGSLL